MVAYLRIGALVELLGESQQDSGGRTWLYVYDLESGLNGWILESILITATPVLKTPTSTATEIATATDTPENFLPDHTILVYFPYQDFVF